MSKGTSKAGGFKFALTLMTGEGPAKVRVDNSDGEAEQWPNKAEKAELVEGHGSCLRTFAAQLGPQ